MAKKKKVIKKKSSPKGVKRKVSPKGVRKKPKKVVRAKKNVKRNVARPRRMVRSTQKKIKVAINNLIFFAILFIISFVLYGVSEQRMYVQLFSLLSMLLGFISLALVIVLLTLFIMKGLKK